MAELLPRAKRSLVNGTPSFWANSFTFSWDAFSSADESVWAAAWVLIGAIGAGVATEKDDAVLILCLAKTAAVTDWASELVAAKD